MSAANTQHISREIAPRKRQTRIKSAQGSLVLKFYARRTKYSFRQPSSARCCLIRMLKRPRRRPLWRRCSESLPPRSRSPAGSCAQQSLAFQSDQSEITKSKRSKLDHYPSYFSRYQKKGSNSRVPTKILKWSPPTSHHRTSRRIPLRLEKFDVQRCRRWDSSQDMPMRGLLQLPCSQAQGAAGNRNQLFPGLTGRTGRTKQGMVRLPISPTSHYPGRTSRAKIFHANSLHVPGIDRQANCVTAWSPQFRQFRRLHSQIPSVSGPQHPGFLQNTRGPLRIVSPHDFAFEDLWQTKIFHPCWSFLLEPHAVVAMITKSVFFNSLKAAGSMLFNEPAHV